MVFLQEKRAPWRLFNLWDYCCILNKSKQNAVATLRETRDDMTSGHTDNKSRWQRKKTIRPNLERCKKELIKSKVNLGKGVK